jgi:hypothetical protein
LTVPDFRGFVVPRRRGMGAPGATHAAHPSVRLPGRRLLAAVDDEVGTGDPAGAVGGQEGHRLGRVARIADAQRDAGARVFGCQAEGRGDRPGAAWLGQPLSARPFTTVGEHDRRRRARDAGFGYFATQRRLQGVCGARGQVRTGGWRPVCPGSSACTCGHGHGEPRARIRHPHGGQPRRARITSTEGMTPATAASIARPMRSGLRPALEAAVGASLGVPGGRAAPCHRFDLRALRYARAARRCARGSRHSARISLGDRR